LNSEIYASITDDKTVLVLVNGDVLPKLKEDKNYYAIPDWNTLQLEWNKKAYSHLYTEEKTLEPETVEIDPENEKEPVE
jgi:hypothetical protein